MPCLLRLTDVPEADDIRETNRRLDEISDYILGKMKETGIKNVSEVGFYGLTYKENVDDVRESPTLQMLESMERHLAHGVKVYIVE